MVNRNPPEATIRLRDQHGWEAPRTHHGLIQSNIPLDLRINLDDLAI
jgi:hypothetical protein